MCCRELEHIATRWLFLTGWLFPSEMAFPRRWHLYWDLNDRKGGTSYSEFKGQSILKIGPVTVKAFRRNEVWLKGQKKAEQLKHRGEGGAVGDEVGVSSHMLSKSGCRVGIWFFGQWMGSHWRALSERVTWCTLCLNRITLVAVGTTHGGWQLEQGPGRCFGGSLVFLEVLAPDK